MRDRARVHVVSFLMLTAMASHLSAQPAAINPTEREHPVSQLQYLQNVPIIPRTILFGNPERARVRLSPDGKQIAFLAPRDGVLNVWVASVETPDRARPVTHDTHRGIRSFFWAYTNRHLLYAQDNDGDEDFHVYCVHLDDQDKTVDLTPMEKISARVSEVSEKYPDEILIAINNRPPHQLHDIYRVNILTGERTLLQENPGFAGFVTDDDYHVRFATTYTPNGGQLYLESDPQAEQGWKEFLSVAPEDVMTTGLAGFDKTNKKIYLLDSRQRNTGALKVVDLETGKESLLAENDKADISDALVHPTEKTIQAVGFTYSRREWQVIDPSIQADLDYLKTVADGEVQITSRSLDDTIWSVAFLMDNGPLRFYLYRREPRKATFLFTSTPELEGLPLVKMHWPVISSRDGKSLVCYLSLPPNCDPDGDGIPNQPIPMVLDVHGGPWARDSWGYNPVHQLLCNRGYAVLNVNYRGSTGFGKEFINAANRQWAGRMHEDLLDAVQWAVSQKIAREDRIAIMGGSYGGYATLVGLTFTPKVFACGVDIVGPSSLVTLLQNPPPYWMPFMPVMKSRVGDHETEEGREFLLSRSPLQLVDRIQRPLLIGQGAQDPRVKKAEADQIVSAMQEHGIPVTYMLYPQEGHGFTRPENRFAFYAVTEAFLAEHLGGRYEQIGDAFAGAVFEVPVGKEQVPGLEQALSSDANK
ncbi:MAG: S9 family peptidase [Pirellulaceae bacterium]|nr:S9 family peptidase [Planctomycetales bacterium]